MRIFLDTSVLLAASGSAAGASREVFRLAVANRWDLITTPYVLEEVLKNLPHLPPSASSDFSTMRQALIMMEDVLTPDRPVVFEAHSDRPILFGALAWADVLLTLDRGDFGGLMDQPFYGLRVLKPGTFLREERAARRLRS